MRAAALAFALAAAGAASAQESAARWYVQLDNDVVFETDRWYTSGVRIARVCNDLEWGLVQEIFTPDSRNPRPVDRAPSARLLASVALHDRSGAVWQTIEGALGVRGPAALGRQSTDAIHRIIPAPEVDWSRQLDNRLDAQVAFTRSHFFGRWTAQRSMRRPTVSFAAAWGKLSLQSFYPTSTAGWVPFCLTRSSPGRQTTAFWPRMLLWSIVHAS